MGQTPPPWHGQAVATQLLFAHDWPGYEVHRLRMEFSEEMEEVGRFQWRKLQHLWNLIRRARSVLRANPGTILFYPPASAKWVPFLRDVIFLSAVRPLAGSTVFIYHASGLPVFVKGHWLRRLLARRAYHHAQVSLEVAQEALPAHQVFRAERARWCPCAIEVKELPRRREESDRRTEVLFVASLQEGKGVLEVLRTAVLLREQGRAGEFRFRIVGKWFSSEFEAEARGLHAELALEGLVDFVGQLTGDDKWQAYADADVFFFPSHYASEATPIVLMEALGMGLPLVTTRWAGIPAMLEGCETSWLCPVRSPVDFAAALVAVAAKRDSAAEVAERAKVYYRANFLPERFIERVERAFVEAAAPVRPGLEGGAVAVAQRGRASTSRAGLVVSTYLADQNPGHDRSFGISRMSQVMLETLQASGKLTLRTISSRTSQQAPAGVGDARILPWGTRRKLVRLLTDHFYPLFGNHGDRADVHYFPKGYLPLLSGLCSPSVVTIHDTIIQYDEDRYPEWRSGWEYAYWAWMLKHTLRRADVVLTVSESSKGQIQAFMQRHGIAPKDIRVTLEPCVYEALPQPMEPAKENYVIHLASCEPHKRTAHLIRWWHDAESRGADLPMLHLIGSVPPEVHGLLASSHSIVKQPFLEESALQAAYRAARALILPSEIEGFGLPALEAYYLGTPVCFVRGTSVEEVLGVATSKGGFELSDPDSMEAALAEVMAMPAAEVRACGLKLRDTYAADKVAARLLVEFEAARKG
ncbi:MAG: glycosyltransferase [Verrucomicrobia bacterium]|nr:MAG: glycosyltransferase [Verrucomicrobiota bacterium]